MKILHTSDWHLGKVFYERPLIEDQKYVLDQVQKVIMNDPHDLLIISGDIYDRNLPPVEAVQLLSGFLTELRKISGIHVAIIPGNHDSAPRMSYCSELMSLSNIHFRTDPFSVDIPVTIQAGDIISDIYMVPFLDPNTYNIHSDENIEREKQTHESAVKEAMDRIGKNLKKERINILAAHLFTRGGLTADSERKFVGTAGEVDPALISGFDYIALGHLHKPQKVSGNIFYPGSIVKYSFSESRDKKHFLSVDFKRGAPEVKEIPIVPLREMIRLKGEFSELMYNDEYRIYGDYYIEAELLDSGTVLNPMSSLRTRFPNILSVKQKNGRNDAHEESDNLTSEEKGVDIDFSQFHNYIHGKNPGVEKMTIFEGIKRSCEKNEAT